MSTEPNSADSSTMPVKTDAVLERVDRPELDSDVLDDGKQAIDSGASAAKDATSSAYSKALATGKQAVHYLAYATMVVIGFAMRAGRTAGTYAVSGSNRAASWIASRRRHIAGVAVLSAVAYTVYRKRTADDGDEDA